MHVAQHIFEGTTTPYTSYDSTKTNLGNLIVQQDGFAGPMPIGMVTAEEFAANSTTTYLPRYPNVIQVTDDEFWIFMVNTTASVLTRVFLWVFNKSTQQFVSKGSITLLGNSGLSHTPRDCLPFRYLYTTGTVAVSGTAVTGSSTAWQTDRFASGARIGFGSTDPTQITTWYYITAIGSDTSITLNSTAGSIAGGTAFVIEEIRLAIIATNVTATDGGLRLVKGLNFDSFGMAIIGTSTDTDNIQASYWLKDAGTVTMTVPSGAAADTSYTNTSHKLWVVNNDTTTTPRIYEYDMRAALTVSGGQSTSAFNFKTSTCTVPTAMTASFALKIGTPDSGVASGQKSLFLYDVSTIFRIPVSELRPDASRSFVIADALREIPSGGTRTMTASADFGFFCFCSNLKMIFAAGLGTVRAYLSKWYVYGEELDYSFGITTGQTDQASTSKLTEVAKFWSSTGVYGEPAEAGGIVFIARGAAAATHQMFAIPIGAHYAFADGTTQQRLITPKLSTPFCKTYNNIYANYVRMLGTTVLGMPPETFITYVRTSGIDDDTGEWIRIYSGDLSEIEASQEIQVMFEFRILNLTLIPSRIKSVAIAYEQHENDSHFQQSLKFYERNSGRFYWRFSTAFGTVVPPLKVTLLDGETGDILADDNTTSPTGIFERSTNGGTSWSAWSNTDKGNETTYYRYTYRPGDLSINRRKIRAVISIY